MIKHGPGKEESGVVTARDRRSCAAVNTTALHKIPDIEMTKRLKVFAERLAQLLVNHSEAEKAPVLLHRLSPQIPSVSCRLDTKNQRWLGAEMRLAWVGTPSVDRSELEELGTYLVQTCLGCQSPDSPSQDGTDPIETAKIVLQLTHRRRFVCMRFDPATGELLSTQNGLLFLRGQRHRNRAPSNKVDFKKNGFSQTYALKVYMRRRLLQQHLTIVFKDGVGKENPDRKRKRVSVAEIPRDRRDQGGERPRKKIRL